MKREQRQKAEKSNKTGTCLKGRNTFLKKKQKNFGLSDKEKKIKEKERKEKERKKVDCRLNETLIEI